MSRFFLFILAICGLILSGSMYAHHRVGVCWVLVGSCTLLLGMFVYTSFPYLPARSRGRDERAFKREHDQWLESIRPDPRPKDVQMKKEMLKWPR